MIVGRLIAAVIGYFCGTVLVGYLYSKYKNTDITKVGSGNAGTTNIFRNFGWKAGLITLFGDAAKPWLAMTITWLLFHNQFPEGVRLLQLYAAFGAVIGHNHPFWMKNFNGGKGVACTAGLILAYYTIEVPICLLLFIGIVALTRYVSVASIAVVISFFIQTIIFGELGWINVTTTYRTEVYVLTGILMLMAIFRHRANIKRLMNGTENKIEFNKKK